jgi:predicted ATPase/class 3 adenylate cyclase
VVGCTHCGTENRTGRKFCAECGRPLTASCPACGAANEPGERFCGDCGASLTAAAVPGPAPVSERRLVSILFADLVGFTTLSESRDPEEVRELLSRYFDACRRLVELYGGTVEKFIGDAVMAVWGTPVAQEDDAERAVRTALDLVAAVSALGDETGAPELRARAGVLTGEAAVNVGAVGEGMVAGDLVNTAARIQSTAEPGTVLVGDATRRATEAAVVFEPVGEHVLKGKAEPVRLYRAVRVTAARGGAQRSTGLEAPFVGRARELRLVKELFHGSAEQSRAQLVSITGIGGIGKSRITWEFEKYIDGLADSIWWHRGRCLAYGEGVAYWALAEMVRGRAGILDGEDQATSRAKLADCLERHLPDRDERAWVEPRLANLLGLEERVDADRQDLFAAWRLFFERLADVQPVILVFEDLQWADAALLAFLEYLLEWSSSQRLYVLVLARPELMQASPEFARGVRNAATIALEPLSDAAMAELLDGYVPGMPAELRERVLERAQGIPLYAVETVRMLIDGGLLVREGSVYRPVGEISTLEVPETLHALVAARLDGLAPDERRLVQDACVLGKTFSKGALAAIAGRDEAELDPLVASLVRKEVLSLQADPRSPEQGQYGFLQELLRQVAYDTLSRRDRKARHLAAVAALEHSFQGFEQEAPEVVATHLLAAHRLGPDDDDADELRARASDALVRAADRAAALAAPEEGRRYLDEAATLADDPAMRAALLAHAADLSFLAGQPAPARERIEEAIALYEQLGDGDSAARAGLLLAHLDVAEGRLTHAEARLEHALASLENAGETEELASTLAQLARMQILRGAHEAAGLTIERALHLAEALALDELIVDALTTRGVILTFSGRYVEATLVLQGAMARARRADRYIADRRAYANLSSLLLDAGRFVETVELGAEIEAGARQRGDRELLVTALLNPLEALVALGRWQEALAKVVAADELEASTHARSDRLSAVAILCDQGELERARTLLEAHEGDRNAEQADIASGYAGQEARLLRAEGRTGEARAAAERGLAHASSLGLTNYSVRNCLIEAIEAALELGDLDDAGALLGRIDELQPGRLFPLLQAHGHRLHARLAGHDDEADRRFRAAAGLFEQEGMVFALAVTRLEHAEAFAADDDALAVARATFEQLGARPWLERADALTSVELAPSGSST